MKLLNKIVRENHYVVECFGPDGKLKWSEEFDNLVPTVGLNDSLDKHLKGSNYTAAWYVGLVDGSPSPAAADTMASHAGWAEVTDYDEGTRPALVLGSVVAGSVDNSASKASFSINATVTIGGALLASVATKGGSTGVLYGIGPFAAGDREAQDGDTLNVTVTATATAS